MDILNLPLKKIYLFYHVKFRTSYIRVREGTGCLFEFYLQIKPFILLYINIRIPEAFRRGS